MQKKTAALARRGQAFLLLVLVTLSYGCFSQSVKLPLPL